MGLFSFTRTIMCVALICSPFYFDCNFILKFAAKFFLNAYVWVSSKPKDDLPAC